MSRDKTSPESMRANLPQTFSHGAACGRELSDKHIGELLAALRKLDGTNGSALWTIYLIDTLAVFGGIYGTENLEKLLPMLVQRAVRVANGDGDEPGELRA